MPRQAHGDVGSQGRMRASSHPSDTVLIEHWLQIKLTAINKHVTINKGCSRHMAITGHVVASANPSAYMQARPDLRLVNMVLHTDC